MIILYNTKDAHNLKNIPKPTAYEYT